MSGRRPARAGQEPIPPRSSSWRLAASLGTLVLVALTLNCGGGRTSAPPPAPAKRFPAAVFDGLGLGMARSEVARLHPIRPSLTDSGQHRRLWLYARPGEYSVDLRFSEDSDAAKLSRIDVHFQPGGDARADQYIARYEAALGAPDARRRKADINAYGDRSHDQYETIWSDATQYVFLTERVPIAGAGAARPAFFLTVKKKEITATGPPTGYVPPPPPKGKDGKPIEESPF